jgi:hypothetical protein
MKTHYEESFILGCDACDLLQISERFGISTASVYSEDCYQITHSKIYSGDEDSRFYTNF